MFRTLEKADGTLNGLCPDCEPARMERFDVPREEPSDERSVVADVSVADDNDEPDEGLEYCEDIVCWASDSEPETR
jgi:hypothetical protein